MINVDLKTLTLEQLQALREAVAKEIASRQAPAPLVLYTNECKDASRYHLGKYKHWAKLVRSVDTTKTNGYAFQGDFLSVEQEHNLPVGSVVVEVCGGTITAFRLTQGGKEKIASASTHSMAGSGFIKAVAEAVAY